MHFLGHGVSQILHPQFLLKKIKSLKDDYRKILQLRFFEDLSYKEISEKMNQPINTVKVKLLRAKNLLSQKIKEDAQ